VIVDSLMIDDSWLLMSTTPKSTIVNQQSPTIQQSKIKNQQ